MTDYVVLVSLDEGATWARYGGKDGTVDASSRERACEHVREASPELRGKEAPLFHAESTRDFKPRQKRKRLVSVWDWGPAGEEPAQGELDTGEAS